MEIALSYNRHTSGLVLISSGATSNEDKMERPRNSISDNDYAKLDGKL